MLDQEIGRESYFVTNISLSTTKLSLASSWNDRSLLRGHLGKIPLLLQKSLCVKIVSFIG